MKSLSDFLTAKRAANRSPRTIEWYEYQLGPFCAFLAEFGLSPEEPATVRMYLADVRERVSVRAVPAAYRALSTYYRWQLREAAIDTNPMERVDRPSAPRRRPRHVSAEHYLALLESVSRADWVGARDRAMVQVLFVCGVRVSELVGLTVADLDITRNLVRVVGKGDRERLVPLFEAARLPIVEYLLRRPAWPGQELWLSSDGYGGVRGALTAEGVRQRLRLLCKRAGLPHVNPHAFRHGLAMHLLNDGHADMSLIQKILGHQDIKTTQQIYAEWLTDGMQSAYNEAMDRASRAGRTHMS